MKRKTFLKTTSLAALAPFVLSALSQCTGNTRSGKRILVLIQLVGGNDGLNTLIPLDNYKSLVEARPNLHIPENKILPLKGTSRLGLHPSLAGFQDLYNHGLMGFIQGVGYENQNYSHFRSSDIWLTGSPSNEVLYTGWMARYLETRFKNYPEGFPNDKQPDPPAIKIGDTGSYLFQGTKMDMSIVIDPATAFEPMMVDSDSQQNEGFAAAEVKTIREILLQTERYSKVIKHALATDIQHSKLYPKQGENSLADQFKVVAKLIKGGLDTSVYLVELKGFDTHDRQADPKDATKGVHADLLAKLAQAVNCFWDDMNHINRENDVLCMTFSEFGRRIMSNAGNGTDHGSSQPIMVFGNQIKGGITGKNPLIPEKATTYDNLDLQYDYRAVFASVLKQWAGASDEVIQSVLPGNFPQIDIVKA
jgi:uncharacterized protein (DUF1501 family)